MANHKMLINVKSKSLYEEIQSFPRGTKGLIVEIALTQFLNDPKNKKIISLIKQNEVSISDILKEYLFNRKENIKEQI